MNKHEAPVTRQERIVAAESTEDKQLADLMSILMLGVFLGFIVLALVAQTVWPLAVDFVFLLAGFCYGIHEGIDMLDCLAIKFAPDQNSE